MCLWSSPWKDYRTHRKTVVWVSQPCHTLTCWSSTGCKTKPWQCITGPPGYRRACGLRKCRLARFPFWVARTLGQDCSTCSVVWLPWVILGTTKGTSIETMRYLLDLLSMETRHKVEQVQSYHNAMQNPRIHSTMLSKKKRGVDWLEASHEWAKQNSQSSADLKQVRDWGKRPVGFKSCYKSLMPENLGTHCREWPAGKANAEVQNWCLSKPTASHMTSWSIRTAQSQGTGSSWGFTVKQGGKTIHEDSGAHSHDLQSDHGGRSSHWLASQPDAQITHAIILTDSMNLLHKVESGMGCPDWHTAMHSPRLQKTKKQKTTNKKKNTQNKTKTNKQNKQKKKKKKPNFCGSIALGTPESAGMNGQIDWQAQQTSHLVCSLAGQRCSETWGTF